MASESGGRGALIPLLAVLLLLGGGGAWNYSRNLARESQEDRPMRGYAEADLEKLLAAYQKEQVRLARRAGATPRATAKDAPGQLVGEKVREFERVQRASQRVRDANGDLAETELMVERIEQELARRDQERDPTAVFIRRLTTIDF
ncbi:MAG TPA: hypothetical protein VII72_08595 [Myxococcota bacterium]|jgi:hypothetical protein